MIQRGTSLRTFVIGTTKIDVTAHIGAENLELDRLILGRFEGSETLANAAFQTLVDRYRDRPLAEYAMARGRSRRDQRIGAKAWRTTGFYRSFLPPSLPHCGRTSSIAISRLAIACTTSAMPSKVSFSPIPELFA